MLKLFSFLSETALFKMSSTFKKIIMMFCLSNLTTMVLEVWVWNFTSSFPHLVYLVILVYLLVVCNFPVLAVLFLVDSSLQIFHILSLDIFLPCFCIVCFLICSVFIFSSASSHFSYYKMFLFRIDFLLLFFLLSVHKFFYFKVSLRFLNSYTHISCLYLQHILVSPFLS